MCSMSVICPLCAVPSFGSLEQLQSCLIKAANSPLACPFADCHEQFLGLDKLTIHLFTHTTLMTSCGKPIMATAGTAAVGTYQQPKIQQQQQKQQQDSQLAQLTIKTTATTTPPSAAPTKRKVKKAKQTKNLIQNEITSTSNASSIRNTSPLELTHFQNASSPASPTPAAIASCDICEFTFRNVELRDMHFRLVHQNVVETSTSNGAAIRSRESSALAEQSFANNEPFKCHLCAKRFKMKGSLRVHLKVVHLMGLSYVNNTPKLSICDRIRHKESRNNTTTTTLPQQQQQPPPQKLNATDAYAIGGTLTLLGSTPGPVTINANGELVQANLGNNLNSNLLLLFNTSVAATSAPTSSSQENDLNNLDAKLTTASVNNVSTTTTSADTNPKIWECDVCAKSFTTKYFLKKHKRLHTGEMPYTCEICARTFTFQQSYHKHLLYHSEVKPHVCAICGRAFKELSTLHNHERIHSGEKPFKCEVCGKCFRQRVSFLVHTRIHTGVMPYKCNVCEKSFRYKVSQRTHKCIQSLVNTATPVDLDIGKSQAADDGSVAEQDSSIEQLSENFIKAFLESNASNYHGSLSPLAEAQQSPASAEISAINDMGHEETKCSMIDSREELNQALLNKTIDDIVIESCQKLGIGYDHDITSSPLPRTTAQTNTSSEFHNGSTSPLQKMQNLRLYSPQQLVPMHDITERSETSVMFDNFLLNGSSGANDTGNLLQ